MTARRYHLDEGTIGLVTGFVDRSISHLTWDFPEGRCQMTIHREIRAPDQSFADLVDQVSSQYGDALPEDCVEETPVDVGAAVPAASRRFMHGGRSPLYHHQIYLDLGDAALVLTGCGGFSARLRVDEVIHTALTGLRLR